MIPVSKNSLVPLVLVLSLLSNTGDCRRFARSDYYDYYNYDQTDLEVPMFVSRPQQFTVEVGQSVIFPCEVKNQGNHALIIKREKEGKNAEQLISVGGLNVIHAKRFVVGTSRLTINKVFPRDAGVYICTFASAPTVILKHSLNVQFSPSISASVPTNHRVAKGSSVKLQCEADGNPKPSIKWSRQEGPLPSGSQSLLGSTMKLDNVDQNEEGSYVCTADNGIGKPSSAVITVVVEYPPQIFTERPTVRTGEGDQTELVCLVRGKPTPKLSWKKDGKHVNHNSHVSIVTKNSEHRHVLHIQSVNENDFGAYLCIAENTQGQEKAVIQVTGLPRQPQVKSSPSGEESHTYTLAFDTESFYPITEYRLMLRRAQINLMPGGLTAAASTSTSWKDISRRVQLSDPKKRDAPQLIRHHIEDLDVATDYEAVVRVKNQYGWSSDSEIFSFSTKKTLAVHQTFGSFFFSSGAESSTKLFWRSSTTSSSSFFWSFLQLFVSTFIIGYLL